MYDHDVTSTTLRSKSSQFRAQRREPKPSGDVQRRRKTTTNHHVAGVSRSNLVKLADRRLCNIFLAARSSSNLDMSATDLCRLHSIKRPHILPSPDAIRHVLLHSLCNFDLKISQNISKVSRVFFPIQATTHFRRPTEPALTPESQKKCGPIYTYQW